MSSASDWGATSPSRSVTTSSRPDRATAIGTGPAHGRDCGSRSSRYLPGTLSAPSSHAPSRWTNVSSRVFVTGRLVHVEPDLLEHQRTEHGVVPLDVGGRVPRTVVDAVGDRLDGEQLEVVVERGLLLHELVVVRVDGRQERLAVALLERVRPRPQQRPDLLPVLVGGLVGLVVTARGAG